MTAGPNGYVSDHSVKDCNTQRSRLEESAGQHNVCSHHKKNEAPAILVGDICPVCSPNFKVQCIDPVHLHPSDNSTADNIIFLYEIKNSIICNFAYERVCNIDDCTCKKPFFIINREKGEKDRKEFWGDYITNLRGVPHDIVRTPADEEPMSDEGGGGLKTRFQIMTRPSLNQSKI